MKKKSEGIWKAIQYILVIGIAIIFAIPFIWMLSTALKSQKEVLTSTLSLFPKDLYLKNFADAWNSGSFPRMFFNSVVVAFCVSVGQILTSALAGYAFAKMNFFGKNTIFSILLAVLVVPLQMIVIPIYLMFSKAHLIDTYWALILPNVANAFGIYLYRQFYSTIPMSLNEAAQIDGANQWQILWKIMFPNARPATLTLFMLTFIAEWNDLFKPIVFTTSEEMRTIQFGLSIFQEQYTTNYTLLMAAALFITVPVVLLFIVGQKYYVEGLSSTGMK